MCLARDHIEKYNPVNRKKNRGFTEKNNITKIL